MNLLFKMFHSNRLHLLLLHYLIPMTQYEIDLSITICLSGRHEQTVIYSRQ